MPQKIFDVSSLGALYVMLQVVTRKDQKRLADERTLIGESHNPIPGRSKRFRQDKLFNGKGLAGTLLKAFFTHIGSTFELFPTSGMTLIDVD